MATIKVDRILRHIQEYSLDEKYAIRDAFDTAIESEEEQVHSEYQQVSILPKLFKDINLRPTSNKIDWIHHSQLQTIVNRVMAKFYGYGLDDARRFDTVIQNIRVLVSGVYAASQCENGPRTKEVLNSLSKELLGKVQDLNDTMTELEDPTIPLTPNYEVYKEILEGIKEISRLVTSYSKAKQEESLIALKTLRETASNHEKIFAKIELAATSANKRGRKPAIEKQYLGEWANKIREKTGKRAELIGHDIYFELDSREIRLEQDEALYKKLKFYIEVESGLSEYDEMRKRDNLSEYVNGAIRDYLKDNEQEVKTLAD